MPAKLIVSETKEWSFTRCKGKDSPFIREFYVSCIFKDQEKNYTGHMADIGVPRLPPMIIP